MTYTSQVDANSLATQLSVIGDQLAVMGDQIAAMGDQIADRGASPSHYSMPFTIEIERLLHELPKRLFFIAVGTVAGAGVAAIGGSMFTERSGVIIASAMAGGIAGCAVGYSLPIGLQPTLSSRALPRRGTNDTSGGRALARAVAA